MELLRPHNHLPWVIPVTGHRHFSITFETPEDGGNDGKLTPYPGYDFIVCAYYMAFNDSPYRVLPTVDVMIIDENDEEALAIASEINKLHAYLSPEK